MEDEYMNNILYWNVHRAALWHWSLFINATQTLMDWIGLDSNVSNSIDFHFSIFAFVEQKLIFEQWTRKHIKNSFTRTSSKTAQARWTATKTAASKRIATVANAKAGTTESTANTTATESTARSTATTTTAARTWIWVASFGSGSRKCQTR